MGFFDRIFKKSTALHSTPNIRFGRYSDSYKAEAQYDLWDNALNLFEEGDYIAAYRSFFQYLLDEKEDNVQYWQSEGELRFQLFQGSKKITGVANERQIKAEAKIAHSEGLKVPFLQRLLQQNFDLKYSRFALDEANNLTIKFDSFTIDGSPYKLYYALKELAISADKQDDLLIDEFRVLRPVETDHLVPLPKEEQKTKYNFIVQQIEKTFNIIDKGSLDPQKYPGAIAYLLLDLIYKLDYLTKPEGFTMETLERIHRYYFSNDGKDTTSKINLIRESLNALAQRPQEAFFKEMYEVKSTFGITNPVGHERVVSFIDGELSNMDWYYEQGQLDYALAIPGYIVGYCLFNYALPKPDRDLFHLYYQIVECAYFRQLNISCPYYDAATQRLQKRQIMKAIKRIIEKHLPNYPDMNPNFSLIKMDNLPLFAKSFLQMVRALKLIK